MPSFLAHTPEIASEPCTATPCNDPVSLQRHLATNNMSDTAEVEVESGSGYQVLPKEITQEIGTVKLFNKWSYEDVEVKDISLT